ncbi:MAG: hypothetical protein ABW213_15520 [Tardiphaga sp.]
MTFTRYVACAATAAGFALLAFSPAHALSMSECSAKYKAAQTAGTLNGQKWNDFRKAECGTVAAATPAAAPAATAAEAKPTEAKPAETKSAAATPAAAPVATGPASFPSAVDAKYAKETPGKARLHTCLDMYNANKSGTGNGGLKWIQKGGGYYSECTKKLKGAA